MISWGCSKIPFPPSILVSRKTGAGAKAARTRTSYFMLPFLLLLKLHYLPVISISSRGPFPQTLDTERVL